MTEKQKMIAGDFYNAQDSELVAGRARARQLTESLNSLPMEGEEQRQIILCDLLGGYGKNFFIENRFQCDYGFNIYLGENFYANFDCLLLDDAPIRIGKNDLMPTSGRRWRGTLLHLLHHPQPAPWRGGRTRLPFPLP